METTTLFTKEQYQACKDALDIVNGGACNGCGVSQALTRAYRAYLHTFGTERANMAPPVLLILEQLAHLARVDSPLPFAKYAAMVQACEDTIAAYEQQGE